VVVILEKGGAPVILRLDIVTDQLGKLASNSLNNGIR